MTSDTTSAVASAAISEKPGGFEKKMQRLQQIVQELEQPDIPLEKNVALFKEGKQLAADCKQLLDAARHEIFLAGEDGLQPFVSGEEETETSSDV